jgi:hypothetical protein
MDFPGVACEECRMTFEVDGDLPDCEVGNGCAIPPLDGKGRRIMDMREKLAKLKDLVDPGTILELYGATRDDLDLLVKVEELMRDTPLNKEG